MEMAKVLNTKELPVPPEKDSAQLRADRLCPIAGPSVVFYGGSSKGTNPYSDRLMPESPTQEEITETPHQRKNENSMK